MTMGHKFLTRISHYLRKGTCQVKHSRSITIGNVAERRKSMVTSIPSVIPSSSSSASNEGDTSSPNASVDIERSHSVSSLDKTHKLAMASTTSRALQPLRRRRVMKHHQQDHSHFIAVTTVAESSNNGSSNANATESVIESSRTFREADRDSISSASSLEILVQ